MIMEPAATGARMPASSRLALVAAWALSRQVSMRMVADVAPDGAEMIPSPLMTADQCGRARAALGWSVNTLAGASGLSRSSVRRLEHGDIIGTNTILAIQRALEAAGVEFTPDGGVRLRAPK
jgi:hypothetical protein